MCETKQSVRWGVVIAVACLAGCVVEEYEPPVSASCVLDTPEAAVFGEPFAVQVSCDSEMAWYEFDFGDGTDIVRSRDEQRSHTYGAAGGAHSYYQITAYYMDEGGRFGWTEAEVGLRYSLDEPAR